MGHDPSLFLVYTLYEIVPLTIGGGIYQAGIIANLWNPVGAIAGAAYVLATAGACSYAAME